MDEQLIRIGLKYAGTVYDLQVSKKTTLKLLAEQLRPAQPLSRWNYQQDLSCTYLIKH